MNDSIIYLSNFNTTIDTWIAWLEKYTLAQLRTQIPNSWSLGQVYMHLIAETQWFVEQMQEAVNTSANTGKTMSENGTAMFANNSFPDIRIVTPSTAVIEQPQSKAEVSKQLHHIRDEVNNLFATHDLAIAKGKTQHPGLGYFSALEWLRFAEMHLRHHYRQKQRIDAVLKEE